MSLRARFVAASSGIALVTLGAAFSAVWVAFGATRERELDFALVEEARDEAIDVSLAPESTSAGRLSLRGGRDLEWAVAYAGSRPVAWTANLDVGRPGPGVLDHSLGAPFDVWWNNEHMRAVRVPLPGSARESMLVAAPRTQLDEDGAALARRMIAALLAAVAISAAATAWLARVLTRDHERIAAVARRVAAGDLSARIGTMTSRDPEMAQLGRDVDEMISRLAVLVETQQRFVANASHELRSPVTTLLGELSFALRRERAPSEYRRAIEEALASTRRLKALTEDLLALARIGGADLEREPVALSEVTHAAIASACGDGAANDVTVEVACGDTVVEGHPGDLQRLLRNLLENAIRHSPPGGRVRVEALHDARDARVVVSDEGPGVPATARERIFEPFFRLPADRADHAGAGLGLAIGRSIARAHGGDLWLDDSPRGARFIVRLPVAGTDAAA